jgi:hypothetical protein
MAAPTDGELMDVVKGKVQDQKCTAQWKVKAKDDDDAEFEYYFVAKVPAYALSAGSEKPMDVVIRQPKYVISKQLMSHGNKPLAFEWVQVMDEDGNEMARGQTDKDGVFFAQVPGEGKYHIRIIDEEEPIPALVQEDDEMIGDFEFPMLFVKVFDTDGETELKDTDFEVTFPDGSKEEGKTDEEGLILIFDVKEGVCKLKIKDLWYEVPTVEEEDEPDEELAYRLVIDDMETLQKLLEMEGEEELLE